MRGGSALFPILACLGAVLFYGLAGVFGRRLKRLGIDPVVGAFGQTSATAGAINTSLVTLLISVSAILLAIDGRILSRWPVRA